MTVAKKINGPEALNTHRDKVREDIALRTGPKDVLITVHMGTCGIAAGARDVLQTVMQALADARVTSVTVQPSGCAGQCDQEPMMTLTDKAGKSFVYGKLNKTKVREIIKEHVLSGRPVTEHLVKSTKGERTHGQR